MTANIPEALILLCQSDGQVVMADREVALLLNSNNTSAGKTGLEDVHLSQFATKVNCADLPTLFESFVANEQTTDLRPVSCGGQKCRLSLRRLNGFQSSPLFAVELIADADEQTSLAEVGRTTARFIHDFKNQMGGLKLYAAYLKKRFAANPDVAEGLEIADKIVHTLNEMTENASLIVKLSRPLELKLSEISFASLVEQTLSQLQHKIDERQLKLKTELAEAPLMRLDAQHMLLALNSLITRAIAVSREGAQLLIKLQYLDNELIFSIVDAGEPLTDEQRQSFFAMSTHERMNKQSLNVALTKRIVEAHGGKISVQVANPTGSEVRMMFGT